ncbi:hypothetical protein, partial [Aminobacter sp. BE322]|uniref:hypothetical protein n=1 Tax=unclassified Aminobacter TaxID=2644704 RepID=UPI003D23E584
MATTGSQFGNNSGEIEGGLALSGNGKSGGGNELLLAQAEGQQQLPAAQAEPVPVDAGSGQPAQAPQPQAAAPAAATPTEYAADASNVVRLPANVSVDNIRVDGANLVLEQADGSVIVIKDAAANVPTFILGDVELPRVALIAALESAGVDVAFGPDGAMSAAPGSANSSGGNFEAPVGGIGDGFNLSALLPPTALQFPEFERRELFPTERKNGEPAINFEPGTTLGSGIVDEAGLKTNGSVGSDPDSDREFHQGTFTLSDPDGLSDLESLTISAADGSNPVTIPISGLVGATFAGEHGTLTITGYDPVTGVVTYRYELTEPTQDGAGAETDVFNLVVSDSDASSAPATLTINIVDDVPDVDIVDGPSTVAEGATLNGDWTLTEGA